MLYIFQHGSIKACVLTNKIATYGDPTTFHFQSNIFGERSRINIRLRATVKVIYIRKWTFQTEAISSLLRGERCGITNVKGINRFESTNVGQITSVSRCKIVWMKIFTFNFIFGATRRFVRRRSVKQLHNELPVEYEAMRSPSTFIIRQSKVLNPTAMVS